MPSGIRCQGCGSNDAEYVEVQDRYTVFYCRACSMRAENE